MPRLINENAKIIMFKMEILTLTYWLYNCFAFTRYLAAKEVISESLKLILVNSNMDKLTRRHNFLEQIHPNYRKALLLKNYRKSYYEQKFDLLWTYGQTNIQLFHVK